MLVNASRRKNRHGHDLFTRTEQFCGSWLGALESGRPGGVEADASLFGASLTKTSNSLQVHVRPLTTCKAV